MKKEKEMEILNPNLSLVIDMGTWGSLSRIEREERFVAFLKHFNTELWSLIPGVYVRLQPHFSDSGNFGVLSQDRSGPEWLFLAVARALTQAITLCEGTLVPS